MKLNDAYNSDLLKAQLGMASDAAKAARDAAAAKGAGGDADAKRWKAALDFESMFLGQMYKAMRKSNTFGAELTEASPGREIFTEMLDQEYAKTRAKSPLEAGTEGMRRALSGISNSLAAQIYRTLSRGAGDGLVPAPEMRLPRAAGDARPAPAIGAGELEEILDLASKTHGVSRDLIRSVIKNESNDRPQAVSLAGAKGLMQLMDTTAADMGVANVFNPRENVMGGTRYLKQLLTRYGNDEALALAAYNAGPANVDKHKGVPPFAETRNYVERVLKTKTELGAARPKAE